MFCSRCGSEVKEQTQYCATCGLDLRGTSPIKGIATGELTERDIVNEALSHEYEVLEELGRGGMAIVYRARDRQLEREVALKVLPFSLAFDAEFVERFQREARTAAQLEHPNIIPIYRVGKSGRVIYFVMKLLRGPSLSKVLLDRPRLTVPEIRRLLVETGSALGYAAKRGVVHRDIKPDNIMFDEFGQCVVADFGIAKAASGQKLTGTGMSIGTPHYMSPEQARAQKIDGRSDIYSLGIVAYQCLAGEVPYDGEDSFAIGYKHIMEPIPTPSLATMEERRLFEIIRKMIMKDPRDRFQDADELILALEGQPLGGAGTQARASASRLNLTSQPTTPIASLQSEAIPPETGDRGGGSHRPVGRRSLARRESERRSGGFLLLVLFLMAAGAGGYYLVTHRGLILFGGPADSTAAQPRSDSTAPVAVAPESTSAPDSVKVAVRPPRSDTMGSAHPSPVTPALRKDSGVATAPAAPVPVVLDSGSLRITGLPKGSSVMIDTRPVMDPQIRLPAGNHELAIVAPGFEFYKDTVLISAGQELVMTPELVHYGEAIRSRPRRSEQAVVPCDFPGPANRFGRACYDEPPRPLGSTRVPLPPGFEGMPNASVFIVRVSTEGKADRVRSRVPSNDPAFEKLAQAWVAQLQWSPAKKDGVPIDGWTQLVIQPDR